MSPRPSNDRPRRPERDFSPPPPEVHVGQAAPRTHRGISPAPGRPHVPPHRSAAGEQGSVPYRRPPPEHGGEYDHHRSKRPRLTGSDIENDVPRPSVRDSYVPSSLIDSANGNENRRLFLPYSENSHPWILPRAGGQRPGFYQNNSRYKDEQNGGPNNARLHPTNRTEQPIQYPRFVVLRITHMPRIQANPKARPKQCTVPTFELHCTPS